VFHSFVEPTIFLFDEPTDAASATATNFGVEQTAVRVQRGATAGLVDIEQGDVLSGAGKADAAVRSAFGFKHTAMHEPLNDLGQMMLGEAQLFGDFWRRTIGTVAIRNPQASVERDGQRFRNME
jgi:hypothetical protein